MAISEVGLPSVNERPLALHRPADQSASRPPTSISLIPAPRDALGPGTEVHCSSHARDNAGNITSITGEAQGNSSFGYDALNRLTSATYPASPSTLVTAQTFTYDANGNRTQHTTIANGLTTTYTYGYTLNGSSQATNQLATVTPSGGSATTYTHDTNGNRTAPVDAAILNGSASYNVPNYQTQTSTNAGTTTYSYNGDGLRYQETRAGTTTFLRDSSRRVPQVVSDGTNTYLYGLGRLARVNGTSTVFYHTDLAGSTRALTRWNGTNVVIEAAFSYEAFGRRTQGGTAPADYGFLFAGEPWDQKTGSYCPRAPYLCPQRQPGDIVFPPCYPCPIPAERSRSQSTSSAWPLGHHLGALRTARGPFRGTNSS